MYLTQKYFDFSEETVEVEPLEPIVEEEEAPADEEPKEKLEISESQKSTTTYNSKSNNDQGIVCDTGDFLELHCKLFDVIAMTLLYLITRFITDVPLATNPCIGQNDVTC